MNFVIVPEHMPVSPAEAFLAAQFPDLPVGYLRQLLKKGKFRRNGTGLHTDTVVTPGDLIIVPGSQSFHHRVAEGSPAFLYESETVLIVNKPASLAVHAGVSHRHDNLLERLAKTLRQRKAPYRLHAVHRLDKETTGALLLAKGKKAASKLGQLMKEGGVSKQYLALIGGELPDSGELQTPVRAHGKLRTATSRYLTLERSRGLSLLKVELVSGRTHQIRRQLADAGAPLLGDRRYGDRSRTTPSFYLHSHRLSLTCAEDCEPLVVTAPLPQSMLKILANLGFNAHPEIPELQHYLEIDSPGLCKSGCTK